jgi:hypothetical protein
MYLLFVSRTYVHEKRILGQFAGNARYFGRRTSFEELAMGSFNGGADGVAYA